MISLTFHTFGRGLKKVALRHSEEEQAKEVKNGNGCSLKGSFLESAHKVNHHRGPCKVWWSFIKNNCSEKGGTKNKWCSGFNTKLCFTRKPDHIVPVSWEWLLHWNMPDLWGTLRFLSAFETDYSTITLCLLIYPTHPSGEILYTWLTLDFYNEIESGFLCVLTRFCKHPRLFFLCDSYLCSLQFPVKPAWLHIWLPSVLELEDKKGFLGGVLIHEYPEVQTIETQNTKNHMEYFQTFCPIDCANHLYVRMRLLTFLSIPGVSCRTITKNKTKSTNNITQQKFYLTTFVIKIVPAPSFLLPV